MKEKKAKFIYNAITLGAFFGIVFGVSEALFLIINKKSLFEIGIVKLGLLFEGIFINGIAGIVLAFTIGAFLSFFTSFIKKNIRYAILTSFLFSLFIVTIISVKWGNPIPFIQRKYIYSFAIILVLSFLTTMFIFNRNRGLINRLDMVMRKFRLIVLSAFFIAFFISFAEAMFQRMNKTDKSISKPNIILIMIDAARPDRFSCYGYERNTTPNIDKIARDGTLFKKAYAHTNWTRPSTSILFTGKYLSQVGVGKEYGFLDDEHLTIAELLARNGYETIAFSNSPWISKKTNLDRGFKHFFYMGERFEGTNYFSFYRVRLLIDAILDRLQGGDIKGTRKTVFMIRKWLKGYDFEKPFFMFVHVIDPHTYYLPPKPYDYLFLDKSIDYKKIDQKKLLFGKNEVSAEIPDSCISILNALYDGEIAYCDYQMQMIFDLLEKMGVIQDTMIVILADHGEYMFEHNRRGHGSGLYEPVLRIPLIVKYPLSKQIGQASVIDSRVGLVDLFPTLCEVAEVNIIEEKMQLRGRSLLNISADHVLIAETDDNKSKCLIKNDMKLIVNSDKDDELYDLRLDSNEQHNLVYEKRELSLALGDELNRILTRYKLIGLGRKKKIDFEQDEVSKLKALGYLQ